MLCKFLRLTCQVITWRSARSLSDHLWLRCSASIPPHMTTHPSSRRPAWQIGTSWQKSLLTNFHNTTPCPRLGARAEVTAGDLSRNPRSAQSCPRLVSSLSLQSLLNEGSDQEYAQEPRNMLPWPLVAPLLLSISQRLRSSCKTQHV